MRPFARLVCDRHDQLGQALRVAPIVDRTIVHNQRRDGLLTAKLCQRAQNLLGARATLSAEERNSTEMRFPGADIGPHGRGDVAGPDRRSHND